MKTSSPSLFALPEPYASRLAELAPSVAFSMYRTNDHHFSWNGDGPDPRDSGLDPYDVDFYARAIVGGEILEGSASLGGSYFQDDEPIGDAHGYLNQKLDEAADELHSRVIRSGGDAALSIGVQIIAARDWLKKQSRIEYDAQRSEIAAR